MNDNPENVKLQPYIVTGCTVAAAIQACKAIIYYRYNAWHGIEYGPDDITLKEVFTLIDDTTTNHSWTDLTMYTEKGMTGKAFNAWSLYKDHVDLTTSITARTDAEIDQMIDETIDALEMVQEAGYLYEGGRIK